MMIDNEKIEGYIKFNSNISGKKELLCYMWLMLIISIPAGCFGIYSEITKIIILPIVFIFSVWILYLFIKRGGNTTQNVLFMGTFSIFLSIILLLGAYKVASTEIEVSRKAIIILIVAYIVNNILYMLNMMRLIKKGYFISKKNHGKQIGVALVASVFGLFIGKRMLNNMSQDKVVVMLVAMLIFLGFFFSWGTTLLLKYYYIKTIEKYKKIN